MYVDEDGDLSPHAFPRGDPNRKSKADSPIVNSNLAPQQDFQLAEVLIADGVVMEESPSQVVPRLVLTENNCFSSNRRLLGQQCQTVEQQDSRSSGDESDESSNTVFSYTSESKLLEKKDNKVCMMNVNSPKFLENYLKMMNKHIQDPTQ